jgi:xylulokinase
LTGGRVIDQSNASFTGLYKTLTLDGWSDELCAAAKISKKMLPDVFESSEAPGNITSAAARKFGLPEGLPVMAGLIDGSSGMLLAGAKVGQLLNVSGSTDVLALCVDHPQPHERLLTRAIGVGRKWLSVSTMAAAGSALNWARDQLFSDLPEEKYWSLVTSLAKRKSDSRVMFVNALAGDRTSIDQTTAAFSGLSLATTRQEMLASVVESLARDSAARLKLLAQGGVAFRRQVVVSGGVGRRMSVVLHRDWPRNLKFTFPPPEATLRGLGTLK